jgi:hypothetical protein
MAQNSIFVQCTSTWYSALRSRTRHVCIVITTIEYSTSAQGTKELCTANTSVQHGSYTHRTSQMCTRPTTADLGNGSSVNKAVEQAVVEQWTQQFNTVILHTEHSWKQKQMGTVNTPVGRASFVQ